MKELTLVIPMVPVGMNHYVKHTRTGRHYVTSEAKAFKETVCIIARNQFVWGKEFSVDAVIYLGAKQRGDVDGFSKLILDGLADARVFRNLKGEVMTDAWVTELHLRKFRDVKNPRTEITIKSLA